MNDEEREGEKLSDEETARRLERALKRSLTTPPKPLKPKKDADASKQRKRKRPSKD